MAHITKFRIEGLLGREQPIEYKLNRDINIFFGGNGSGKTTLLKILDAAMSRNAESMSNLPVTRAEVWIYSEKFRQEIQHVWINSKNLEKISPEGSTEADQDEYGTLEKNGNFIIRSTDQSLPNEALKAEAWNIINPPKLTGPAWKHTFLPTDRLLFGGSNASFKNIDSKSGFDSELDRLFTNNITRSWLKVYSSTLESVKNIQQAALQQVLYDALGVSVKEHVDIGDDIPQIYRRVCSFLARTPISGKLELGSESDFAIRYTEEPDLRRLVSKLNNLECDIEKALAPTNAFENTIKSLFSAGKSIQLKSDGISILLTEDKIIPISKLSSGEKHLVKILLDAISAEFNSFIIDEPELSMHIDWQSRFCKAIQSINPECQLILASHSPEIMADVDDSRIFKI